MRRVCDWAAEGLGVPATEAPGQRRRLYGSSISCQYTTIGDCKQTELLYHMQQGRALQCALRAGTAAVHLRLLVAAFGRFGLHNITYQGEL